jgi:NAD(P)-dependent dehydrogenase (short-subunit alcohol dehydrogenase family)
MAAPSRPVTIVTGGSRGIGAATVLALARDGHDVALAYREDARAAAEVAAAAQAAGARAIAVRADVTSETDVEALFASVAERLGTVTGLVNNAGTSGRIGDLADTAVATIRRVLDVNLLGALLCARRAAQVMPPRHGGRGGAIVNVSSAAATLGSPHEYVAYAAAKAGVDTLTVGLAKELAADAIRVNAVAPGIVHTGIHAAGGDPGRPERLAPLIPLGRPGEPDEIAPAITWLLAPAGPAPRCLTLSRPRTRARRDTPSPAAPAPPRARPRRPAPRARRARSARAARARRRSRRSAAS